MKFPGYAQRLFRYFKSPNRHLINFPLSSEGTRLFLVGRHGAIFKVTPINWTMGNSNSPHIETQIPRPRNFKIPGMKLKFPSYKDMNHPLIQTSPGTHIRRVRC
jgi:hypothetical protein